MSQAQIEQSVGSETYGFDSIRGIQAGRDFYVAICPLKIIPKLFIFNESDLSPEFRAQRTLREARIPALKNYILNNPNDYIFSSLAASVDGVMRFAPSPNLGENGKLGRLYIDMAAKLLINDGQHRRKAIEEALKERPELGHESISVVFFEDAGLKRSQQMFSDLNKNAVKPTKSLNILYDHRDQFSQFIVKLTSTLEIFQKRVELEETKISNRSTKFFTLNGVTDSTMKLLSTSRLKKISNEQKEIAKEYWEQVAKNIPEWQLMMQGKVSSYDLRQNYVHANTNCLNALGIAGRIIIAKYPNKWKEKLRGLKKIDWSRSNPEWEGRLLTGGRMIKNSLNIELAANYIIRKLGMRLSKERLGFEAKNV